ncbi:FAD-binding oxidoreductase [Aspergillus clavatus NRRL 1]|uniref:FAD binding domain protein n=1 Tax=Aspergillus clavatus (strain ATCC 1007 / CBS 513.65 / DSM 816 / NCTC 3887 / NRRL 1 / QM 1276 / 107) TaxID=344612 RepID=A1CM77_ASPCL|nr:FAD binding domain protein [Aspergillus clavatus NRRL 1]EAW08664.1 FAD binding domain protein [Aspergillus clavatus NRRL 1]
MMLPYLAPLVAVLATTVAGHGQSPVDMQALLGPLLSPSAQLYLPNDAEYAGVNERWSSIGGPSYAAAVRPATEEDVRNIVKVASEHDIPFLATGTSHSVKPGLPGYTTLENAIHIDLSQMKDISLDHESNTVTIGPGVTNDLVYDTLYAAKRETPISTDRCLSTLGTMVGGGLGSLQGVRGILADSLVSAHVVTAAGELITVSKDSNPDLFWAIRGAGHNFGIVVSATFRTYEPTNGGLSWTGDFIFPNSQNASVFELVKSLDDGLPIGVFYGVMGTFNKTTKEPLLTVRLIVMGDEEYAAPHLAKVMDLNPLSSTWESKKWNTYGHNSATMCEKSWNVTLYSIGMERTDVSTLSEAWTNWSTFSVEREMFDGFWMVERHPEQVLLAVPEEERGVYPWRDTKLYMFFVNYMLDASHKSEVHATMAPMRAKLQEVMGFENQHAYVNEAYGDEGPEVWFGAHNLPRLVALKQKWDPKNQFGAGMPIPLSL